MSLVLLMNKSNALSHSHSHNRNQTKKTQNSALKYLSPLHSYTIYGMIRFVTNENHGKTFLAEKI